MTLMDSVGFQPFQLESLRAPPQERRETYSLRPSRYGHVFTGSEFRASAAKRFRREQQREARNEWRRRQSRDGRRTRVLNQFTA